MNPTANNHQPTPTPAAKPASRLDCLPDELIINILNFALRRDTPFDLERCIDIVRSGSRPLHDSANRPESPFPGFRFQPLQPRDATQYPEWHKVHLQDWLVVNATCRRLRRLGREIFFRNRTCVVTQLLLGKLKRSNGRGSGGPEDRLFHHPLLLDHVQEIILTNVNVVSASKFLKLPRFFQSFPNLKTCTLLLDHHIDDHIDQIKDAAVIQDGGPESHPRNVTSCLRKLLVDIGMDENIGLQLALYEMKSTESWQESIIRGNVFPMLKQRKLMMSYTAQTR